MPSRRVIADALSLGNAGCGLLGVLILTAGGEARAVTMAAVLVFAGWALDAVDGAVARAAHTDRAGGVVLDSLCDVVTFGALPAAVAVATTAPGSVARWITVVAAATFLASAILRLRRYTVQALAPRAAEGEIERLYFRGLPTPAAAMTVASGALAVQHAGVPAVVAPWLVGAALLLTAALMLSALPYADVPRHLAGGARPWIAIAVPVVVAPVLGVSLTLMAWFALYVAGGLLSVMTRRRTTRPGGTVCSGGTPAAVARK